MIEPAGFDQAVSVLFEHRAVNHVFECACGWRGDGFGDPHRAHQVEMLLAARMETPCPACNGVWNVEFSDSAGLRRELCPDCHEGMVASDLPLIVMGIVVANFSRVRPI